MSSLVISGDTSGTVTVAAPAVAGSNTLTLQAATATISVNTLATAVASTSGTSIDFTALPSWIKRITVQFSGVSTSGTSAILVQIGAGSVTSTGYVSSAQAFSATATSNSTSTAGFLSSISSASSARSGQWVITNITGNTWVCSNTLGDSATSSAGIGGGTVALGGTLDRVRITTVNGTDTFDAGSVNLLYEG